MSPTATNPDAAPAPFSVLTPELAAHLRERLGTDRVLTDAEHRHSYGHDFTEALEFLPEAVVLPETVEQVQETLRFASAHYIPVTPRGAGTGLSGGALAVHGGLCLSLERLDRIRSLDPRNLTVVAEAGVITGRLQAAVEEQGLFYPPDPASKDSCMLGGNLAEDSAGPRSCKYGSTRKWVLGLEAVLSDGTCIETGGANRKDVTGYNLTQLLVGSEGTLAVLTAATLRLLPLPRETLTLALPFPRLEQAAAAVEAMFREGVSPAACEMLDGPALQAVARVESLPRSLSDREALLLLELDGDDQEALLAQAAGLGELAEGLGGDDPLVALDAAEQRRLWQIRRKVAEGMRDLSVFKEADTVVPRSRLVELVAASRRIATAHGLTAINFGHAGDGNLHVNLLRGDLSEQEWERRRDRAETELFQTVVDLGGAITAEHGVGWTQRRYLGLGLDASQIRLMAGLKETFDPQGILNPGKIFPENLSMHPSVQSTPSPTE